MSRNRNKYQDRRATVECIKGLRSSLKRGRKSAAENWLGHKRENRASKLDEMLLLGASLAELEKVRGGISSHLHHLRVDHGLVVERSGDFYRFALQQHPRRES
jgi:hypothetical protein